MKNLFLLFFIAFNWTNLDANTISQKSITVNDKKIILDNPLINKNNTLYFPVSSLKKELGYKINHNKKINGYNLKFEHFKISLSKNSRELWINNNPYFFSQPNLKFKNELYIPLKEFMHYAGFKYQENDNKIIIKREKIPIYNKKNIKLLANKTSFPILKADTTTKIIHNNFKFPIKNKFFYKNLTCFVDMNDILKELGYIINVNEKNVSLSYGKFNYKIPLNSRNWELKTQKIKQSFTSSDPITIVEDKIYYPIESLLTFLDYSIHQRWFKNEIILLSNINYIETQHKDEMLQINIHSRHKLSYNVINDIINQKKAVEIPFSLIKLNKQTNKITHNTLNSYSVKKQKNFTNKFKLNYENSELNLFIKDNKHGLSLQFNPSLELITELSNSNTDEIFIESIGNVTANIVKEEKGKKIIIDFDKTINNLPQILKRDNKSYSKIRTSQLSTTPLKTRVVIDFENEIPAFRSSKINNKFRLSIDHPVKEIKEEALITLKSSKKATKKITKKRNKRNILENKVVIIDPGHGGTDPGAVVKNRFEKDYTLDVAKRLKKKLTQAGAYVIMTREKDVSTSLSRRAYISNTNKGDIFISIHMNSFNKSYVNGTETYYYKYKDKSLALHIQKQLNKDIQLKNNGIKQSRLFVLRHTKSPSCLIEPLFLTNKKEHALVKTTSFREKLAGSIFQGIKNYFTDINK